IEPDEEPESEPDEEADDAEEGDEGEDEDEPAAEDEADEKDDSAEEAPPAPAYEDVEIQAFLAKYGGDPEKALKGAAELARLMGRRDDEKDELLARNAELERRMFEAQAFSGSAPPLSEEQQAWVEGAAMSPNPAAYVRQAVEEGA